MSDGGSASARARAFAIGALMLLIGCSIIFLVIWSYGTLMITGDLPAFPTRRTGNWPSKIVLPWSGDFFPSVLLYALAAIFGPTMVWKGLNKSFRINFPVSEANSRRWRGFFALLFIAALIAPLILTGVHGR